jgi:tetratricopeptide (TPR) repeat protein
MLREAIERRARSLGRDRGAHRAAAEMLRSQVGPAVAERLGRHLLAAGEGLLALGPLLEGVRERFEAGEIPEADALLALRDAAIEQAALPEADLRWGQGWIQRARIVERQGDLAAAELWLDKAALHARKHGWQQLRARAERERGRTARNLGQGQAAWRRLGRAERMAEELTDRALLSEIRRDMSDLRLDLGDTEGAEALVRKALDDAEAVRDAPGAAGAHLQLGNICIRVGRLPEAERHVQKAMQLFRDAGHRWGYASAVNMAGEAARYQGRFDDAERKYRESLRILLSIGEEFGVFPETNLGLLLLERGQWKEARRYLEAACQGFERQGRRGLLAAVHAFLLPACAEAGDWEGFSAHLERAESLLGETAFTDLDIVRTARMAAAAALAAGRRAEARRAWALAVAQLRGLDRAEEAEDLEREAGRG